MQVVEDLAEGERRYALARGDAGAWPTWGEAPAVYLVWVDDAGGIRSLLVVDPEDDLTVVAAQVALAARVAELEERPERPWPGGDDERRSVLLRICLLDDGTWEGGFGPMDAPAHRRRPIAELLRFAADDLQSSG